MKRNRKSRLLNLLILIIALLAVVFLLDNTAKIIFPSKYLEYVNKYSSSHNIDPYLVLAIIKAESNFNPNAVSSKKAKGLMQISDQTGKWGAQELKLDNYGSESLFDPETNISIGCWYLDVLIREFNNNLDLALTAYNGGSGNVSEWLKNKNYSSSGSNLDKIPYKETENYLKKVKNCYFVYKKLYESGI